MEFKYNTKQRIRTIQGLRSFKDALPTNVRKIIKKKGRIYSETLDKWRYIVGDDLFKVCYPKSFKSSNKLSSSILNIMVKRGHEVDTEYSKNLIVEKMNKFFGYKVDEKIKLITFDRDQIKFNSIDELKNQLSLVLGFHIIRNNEIIIPSSKYVFKKNDIIILLSKRDQLPTVENMFRISSI